MASVSQSRPFIKAYDVKSIYVVAENLGMQVNRNETVNQLVFFVVKSKNINTNPLSTIKPTSGEDLGYFSLIQSEQFIFILPQVFLIELRRIESELQCVTDELDKVTSERKKASWERKKLRFLLAWQIICRCFHHFFTMISYLFFGFLHVTYVLLWLGASMVQTVLESQSFLTGSNNHIQEKPTTSRSSSRRSTDAPFWS